MGLTVTESISVNVLLNYITGRPGADGRVPSAARALESAQVLADHANRTLMAGWRGGALLREAWPKEIDRVR